MNILVLFDTVEGHTHKIADFVARRLEGKEHLVTETKSSDLGYCDPGTFDAAILCAPIHIGQYPSPFVQFVQDWKQSLLGVSTALISVSLAISSDNDDEVVEAKAYPDTLFEKTGWKPDDVHHAAGALKYVEYNFFKRWMMRRLAGKVGQPQDINQDHELTDWKALEEFVDGFEASLKST